MQTVFVDRSSVAVCSLVALVLLVTLVTVFQGTEHFTRSTAYLQDNPGNPGSSLQRFLTGVDSEVTSQVISSKMAALNQSVYKLLQMQPVSLPEIQELGDDMSQEQICQLYVDNGNMERSAITNVWKEYVQVDQEDITFVSQLSLDRLPLVGGSLKRWTGPFSLTIYLSAEQANELIETFRKVPDILERRDIDVHLVLQSGTFYPVNYLRNVALNNSHTQYVFLSDADFIPMAGLHDILKNKVAEGILDFKQVPVIPAFETSDALLPYPASKTDLVEAWDRDEVIPFFMRVWKKSHGPTDYERWKDADQPYKVIYEECYEPYILMRRSEAPAYNEHFVGWYRDKISHLLEVHMRGFNFLILPDVFTIHYPHESAPDKDVRKQYYPCALKLYTEFLTRLKKGFPGRL